MVDATTASANAGLALGVVSLILVVGYIYYQEFMTVSSSYWDTVGYGILFILLFVLCMDTAYMSIYSAGNSTPALRNGLIGTTMTMLALSSIALGIAVFKINGTNNVENKQYVQFMLPANFLITVIATSIIIMQKLTSV